MRNHRPAFTSIELLVVIALIAILGALLMAGVMSVRGKQFLATTSTEIREIGVALENFKTKYSIYPPSRVQVSATKASIDTESQRVLDTIWPALDYNAAFGSSGWNVTGTATLQGDQCLVLFLGGIHSSAGCQGFSTSKKNPFTTGGDREQPYFNFKPERLYARVSGSPFHSYADGWNKFGYNGVDRNTAYAYFAPTKSSGYVDTHCNTLVDGKGIFPQPYKDTSNAYLNRNTYQLISSGKDTLFGTARQWAPGAPTADMGTSPDSADNLANFATGLLTGG